ncbi:MAG TPA: recombinase family protein [Ramlibacter sp.]|uniref:recombinase family protein n=1 Tax=Ramlibacter sp. TaxID=1917967 RepID=UPI002C67946F|nr:recombinase family protein [Ramlibacter sp.]HVZ47067.1 recombinase family protein [Ramlibacter sp.]
MSRLAYYRVSTTDQNIESQRAALGGAFDKEFTDEGISGAIPAAQRPGFAALLQCAREDDTIHVYAVDRLRRDALDVQATVRAPLKRKVSVDVRGLGVIAEGAGELILAVLAQVADMERQRINERTAQGRHTAREALAGHRQDPQGQGEPWKVTRCHPELVKAWRMSHSASIAQTARSVWSSVATVKRYCAN